MTTLLDLMERPAAMVPPAMVPEPPSYSRVPQRLQRSRKRGAKLPETAVYVGRPTLFANPFRFERFGPARYATQKEGQINSMSGAHIYALNDDGTDVTVLGQFGHDEAIMPDLDALVFVHNEKIGEF